ncbi:MAG: alpha/beta hydrolase [Bryobacteraceae bacterium]|nr:alpha/beta hydrolase [Bryobacteraceae bacterium]
MRAMLLLLVSLPLLAETAELEGTKIYYAAAGRGAHTVVLIHGWTCDHTLWDAQMEALKRRYRVIALDLPGHGRSGAAPEYSMKRFARAVNAVMAKENVRQAVLAGHSMGGAVMLEFARLYQEQVLAIVAVDAIFPEPEAARSLASLAARFEGADALEERRKIVRGMFTDATKAELRLKIESVMLAAPADVAAGAMRGIADLSVWREDRIDLPFVEIAAETSTYVTEDLLKKRFPRAKLVRVPGTGHFLHIEKPAEVNRILLEWLAAQGL